MSNFSDPWNDLLWLAESSIRSARTLVENVQCNPTSHLIRIRTHSTTFRQVLRDCTTRYARNFKHNELIELFMNQYINNVIRTSCFVDGLERFKDIAYRLVSVVHSVLILFLLPLRYLLPSLDLESSHPTLWKSKFRLLTQAPCWWRWTVLVTVMMADELSEFLFRVLRWHYILSKWHWSDV